jgi:hypothetical protein
MATGAFLAYFLLGMLYLIALQPFRLFSLLEIGYGDSYIFYDVDHFRSTGTIYRDSSQPPYLPAQYSPMVYILYSLPGRVIHSANPFLPPRIAALIAFLGCLAMVVSIARVYVPIRVASMWTLAIATCIPDVEVWVLQLRGDFPGIFFGLVAIRLLLSRLRHAALLAGICAGFALQFKILYVAPAVAGFVWLLLRKRWKDLAAFAAAAVLSSAGLYLLFWLREPRMISQMLALAPAIRDFRGGFQLLRRGLASLAVLVAIAATPLPGFHLTGRWTLLLIFVLTAVSVGAVADVQAGGNINYFFEGLLGVIPFAAFGVIRLIKWSHIKVGWGLFLTGLVVTVYVLPRAKLIYDNRIWLSPQYLYARNERFRKLEIALGNRRIFSTVPRLALLDPHPPLTEPFLLEYLRRLGKFDPDIILSRVRRGEFDVVITFANRELEWRGIRHLEPAMADAIASAYRPYCMSDGYLLYVLSARLPDAALVHNLAQAGCMPSPKLG